MLKIQAVATVYYTYELTEEEEQAIRNIIKENPDEFSCMPADKKIALAYEKLYEEDDSGICHLYDEGRTTESDSSTEEFNYSEFNDVSAEEWLDNADD